ncbi:unnamed protein product [Adineta ricciae]|uniref:Uncharacterized protein n=1 Tax=Adineta ricciae TaxID=249248 RepID=A0A816HK20_ADIRI|nr:unnamed protein product [Adineta ricciae]
MSGIDYIQNSIDTNKNEIARIDSGINEMRCRLGDPAVNASQKASIEQEISILECNKYSLKATIDQLEMEKDELQGENPNSLLDEKEN